MTAKRLNAPVFYTAFGAASIGAGLALALWPPSGWAAIVAIGAVITVSFAVAVWAYRRVDETAREAQKSAWLWGGTVGGFLAVLAAISPTLPQSPVASLLPAGMDAFSFSMGAVAVLVAQSVAYTIVWAIWWLSKR